MREEMERLKKKQVDLEKRRKDIERRPGSLNLTHTQEAQIRRLVATASANLKSMDFAPRQELLQTVVEEVVYTAGQQLVKTIIPLGEQLHPVRRGG